MGSIRAIELRVRMECSRASESVMGAGSIRVIELPVRMDCRRASESVMRVGYSRAIEPVRVHRAGRRKFTVFGENLVYVVEMGSNMATLVCSASHGVRVGPSSPLCEWEAFGPSS